MEEQTTNFFRGQAAVYRSARPEYPAELYAWLAAQAPARGLVWEAGAGSGQASVGLAEVFERVVATDVAAEQIERARTHPRVRYAVGPEADSGLGSGAAHAVVAATAAHWFDLDAFWAEARRVLAPGGLVAVWAYGGHRVEGACDGAIKEVTSRYASEVIGGFWSTKLDHIQSRYATIPFPFDPLSPPEFRARKRVDLAGYMAYLGSWSASQRYREAHGAEPLDRVRADLEAAWGDPMLGREVSWDVFMRAGRV